MVNMKRTMAIFAIAAAAIFGSVRQAQGQAFADTVYQFAAADCPGSSAANGNTYAGTAGTGTGLQEIGATATPVYQVDTTNSGTNTHTYVCEIRCPTRLAASKGCTAVQGVAFFYGVQANAIASQTLSTAYAVTFSVPAASESASTVGGAAAGGTITQLPAVGSVNTATTSAGAFYTTYAAFGTAYAFTGVYTKLYVTFVFGCTATTATKTNNTGGVVFTTNTIAWMKKHGAAKSVEVMASMGISRKTAKEIVAHYHVKGFEKVA